MKRFKFNLESVLIIRAKALKDERIRLASILNVYNKQQKVLEEMNNALANACLEAQNCSEDENFNPTEITNYNLFINKLTQDIKTQKEIIKKTFDELNIQQEKTKEAYIKVKSLENLKEKKKEEYNKEFLLEEMKILDDIVNSKRITA